MGALKFPAGWPMSGGGKGDEDVTTQTERARKMAEKKRLAAESRARIEAAHAETHAALESNSCPTCGSGARRNIALSGWVQCEQFGADGRRARNDAPACSWQGFTS